MLSRRERASGISLCGAKVALFGAESSDCGRSKRRRGSEALPGVVGDTIDATLMLPAGDTRGCGKRLLLVVGEGVLSLGEGWKWELPGLSTLAPKPEAADVSEAISSVPIASTSPQVALLRPKLLDTGGY